MRYILGVFLAFAAAGAACDAVAGAKSAGGAPIVLHIGDTIQLAASPVGCKAGVRSGVKTLDCRVAGPLAGSYGTLMSGGRVLVIRFRTARTAKVVFEATQRGYAKTCR